MKELGLTLSHAEIDESFRYRYEATRKRYVGYRSLLSVSIKLGESI